MTTEERLEALKREVRMPDGPTVGILSNCFLVSMANLEPYVAKHTPDFFLRTQAMPCRAERNVRMSEMAIVVRLPKGNTAVMVVL